MCLLGALANKRWRKTFEGPLMVLGVVMSWIKTLAWQMPIEPTKSEK